MAPPILPMIHIRRPSGAWRDHVRYFHAPRGGRRPVPQFIPFSQTGHIGSLFYRSGFWLVGRRPPRHVAVRSLTNRRLLVVIALGQ